MRIPRVSLWTTPSYKIKLFKRQTQPNTCRTFSRHRTRRTSTAARLISQWEDQQIATPCREHTFLSTRGSGDRSSLPSRTTRAETTRSRHPRQRTTPSCSTPRSQRIPCTSEIKPKLSHLGQSSIASSRTKCLRLKSKARCSSRLLRGSSELSLRRIGANCCRFRIIRGSKACRRAWSVGARRSLSLLLTRTATPLKAAR